jgi:16S rRNA (guanine(966)-N(2))-methyltransferase RsmD
MRIIAGTLGGRRISAPSGTATRPTSDRVREALFSILGRRVVGARVLDLFAGSGALGIEALSRGAASAVFVDDAPAAVRAVRANLHGLEAEVVRRDARSWLRTARDAALIYDLVFLDPPYRQAPELGSVLAEPVAAVLAPGGLVVSECDRRTPLDLPTLTLEDERRYGDTLIRFHAATD